MTNSITLAISSSLFLTQKIKSIFLFTLLITLLFVGSPINSYSQTPDEKFFFGTDTNESSYDVYRGLDVISGPWVLDSWKEYNTRFLETVTKNNQIPYLYLYTIASMAKKDRGLTDCNVPNNNKPDNSRSYDLCSDGANFLSTRYWQSGSNGIIENYRNIFQSIRSARGDKPIYLHFEPDYYQYFNDGGSQGNTQSTRLNSNQMRDFMAPIINLAKYYLPQAKIVIDISPWVSDLNIFKTQLGDLADYYGLVGKEFKGTDYVIDAGRNYKALSEALGKKLIVNTSHYGGGNLPLDLNTWNCDNTKKRAIDGVAGLIMRPKNSSEGYQYRELATSCEV